MSNGIGKLKLQSDYAEEMQDIADAEKKADKIAEANQEKLGKRSLYGTIGSMAGKYLLPALLGLSTGGASLFAQMGGGILGGGLLSLLSGNKLKDVDSDVTKEGLFAESMRKDLKTKSKDIFRKQKGAGEDILQNLAISSIMSPLAGATGKELLGDAFTPTTGPLTEDASIWQKFLQSKFGSSLSDQLTSDFPMYFSGQDQRTFSPPSN